MTKQLRAGEYYDFDYDSQIIAPEKWDAKKTCKMNTGNFGDAATIGNMTVCYENRDGNANVKLAQADTLKRAYKVLTDNGTKIRNSRMDAGSYSKEIIETVAQNSEHFYIRAGRSRILTEQIQQIAEWQTIEINFKKYQVASIPFTQFFAEKNYRLVIAREKSDDRQLNLFESEKFKYRCILTGDHEKTEKEVIECYNQRGAREKTFDIQNNEFGWGHLPCSDMNKNTVYLILTAMLKNFYNYIVKNVAKTFRNILPHTRLKRFIFRFIYVAGKWVRRVRENILKLYSNRAYDRLQFR
ncbi:MAG: transposase [Bacteroidales bacterium]|nr:transposase [Bacteroidales bacterium]